MATYFSLAEKALRVGATTVVAGRLRSTVPVGLADVENAAVTQSVDANYELYGPGDVVRLAAGAISRRFPTPGSSDAEEPKVALVEFGAIDLPWRYTPAAAAGTVLRPWLVLVVGVRSPEEIILRPDGRIGLGTAIQQAHDLTASWQWAHVHEVDTPPGVARILSPVDLAADTDYVACLVPAFSADGADAWTGAAPVTSTCYDRWTFRTGPQGDFPELAAQLHKADLAKIETNGGKPFGKAEIGYDRRASVPPQRVVLSAAGALRLPPDPAAGPDPADQPPPVEVATETAHLTGRIVTPDGRGVVTAPRYDAPFATLTDQAGFSPGGWIDQLRSDPRIRGAAGLGAWNAIEWQDQISHAATAKLAGLAIAEDRIRHVALGVEASRSLWRRRVPALPADLGADPEASLAAASELLGSLGPVLGRLLTTAGDTVLDAAGRTPGLARALFSSAARRALRPGPARTARAAAGAGGLGGALRSANQCPSPAHDPADSQNNGNVDPPRIQEAIKAAVVAAAGDDALAERIMDRLIGHGQVPGPGELAAALQALLPGKDGKPDPDAVAAYLNGKEYPDPTTSVDRWTDWVSKHGTPTRCAPVDLVGLAQAVAGAVDPTVARPPAVERVLATLPELTHIGPVEIEPELDLPLWSFLSTSAPDWMLPGAGDLIEGDVVALATNPTFVEALLVGANVQTTAELRWRNISLVSRWSPLRKFWQRSSGALDISPVRTWPEALPLGSPSLTDGGHGSEAVIAFKSPLFKRYPSTVVYLYRADIVWTPPGPADVLNAVFRVDHTFTGTLGADITFFGFPIDPGELTAYWVVLEEPPSGYRFFAASAELAPDSSAANYAHNRFAPPVRVLIGPLL